MGSFDYVVGLIENHHNVVNDQYSGEEIHVFAFAGPPTFGDASKNWDFDITFGVGPATFEVSVTENNEP
jgi:hypothetical protein